MSKRRTDDEERVKIERLSGIIHGVEAFLSDEAFRHLMPKTPENPIDYLVWGSLHWHRVRMADRIGQAREILAEGKLWCRPYTY